MPKTIKKHFDLFVAEFEYWIERFHLREWKIYYKHEKSKKLPDTLAWITTNWKGRSCVVGLNPDWGEFDIVSDFELCRCAFHEVCELLLSDLGSIATMDICPTQGDEFESKVHSVIRRMEWAIWQLDWEGRKN